MLSDRNAWTQWSGLYTQSCSRTSVTGGRCWMQMFWPSSWTANRTGLSPYRYFLAEAVDTLVALWNKYTLCRIEMGSITVILIVLGWPRQMWYANIVRLLVNFNGIAIDRFWGTGTFKSVISMTLKAGKSLALFGIWSGPALNYADIGRQ